MRLLPYRPGNILLPGDFHENPDRHGQSKAAQDSKNDEDLEPVPTIHSFQEDEVACLQPEAQSCKLRHGDGNTD